MTEGKKKALYVMGAAVLLAGVSLLAEERGEGSLDGGRIARKGNGEGDYEAEMIFSAGDLGEFSYSLTVPEQKLTGEEETAFIKAAKEEIWEEFPGENETYDCIREAVCIRGSYQAGRVLAEWAFDNYDLMDCEGNVIGAEIPEQGTPVNAAVELQCGESVVWEELAFVVFPAAADEKTELLALLEKEFQRQGEQAGAEYITLPETVGKYRLEWKEKRNTTAIEILLLGLVLAAIMPALEKSRQEECEKKRRKLLELEYPDMVGKMALLLGAGMTSLAAWKKISAAYEKKRKTGRCPQMPAYEEMLIISHEIESGIGEQRGYEEFGNRCGLSCYRRFAGILAQNIKKGSAGLSQILEKEAENAFEERKRMARKCGEEASTKLLAPMLLMLGIVIMILVVPAIATFRI